MAPLLLIPALALLLGPVSARAADARGQAGDAALLSGSAQQAPDETGAREAAARPFDGGNAADRTVVAPGVTRGAAPLAKPAAAGREAKVEPPPGVETKPEGGKLTTGLMLGGAALLGGLQGWFSAGLLGAAAGAGLGLAAAWLFHKKDYGGAFGVTAGAIIGTAFGGPIGGLIGAVVGGVIGHFLGKLFG
jgi:hypothetical protein